MSVPTETFEKGDLVRLRHDHSSYGSFVETAKKGNRIVALVRMPKGLTRVPIDQVELVPGAPEEPAELLRREELSPPSRLRQVLAHIRLTGKLADIVYSLEATNTDFYAHQFKPVLKMLNSPTGNLLVADEVGLGKTIEAGLVWTELQARFEYRRLLVVCPAILCRKWRTELREKFDLPAEIYSKQDLLDKLQSRNEFDRGFVAICSLQGLRPPKGWNSEKAEEKSAQFAQFLFGKEDDEPLFDLVIFDEAHHLRNPETQNNAGAQLIKSAAEHLLFLSATPINLKNRDLFSLLNLIDPETFEDQTTLEEIISANQCLLAAREALLRESDLSSTRDLVTESLNHPLLAHSQQLLLLQKDLAELDSEAKTDERAKLAARLENSNLLANLVNRTRRRDVQDFRVHRDVRSYKAEMSERERLVYDRITDVVVDYAEDADIPAAFLRTGPQRLLASSIAAALEHWGGGEATSAGLEDAETDRNGDSLGGSGKHYGPLVTELRAAVRTLPPPSTLAAEDSKYAELLELLREYVASHPSEKIILFSGFISTLDYLSRRLEKDGMPNTVLHSGVKERTKLIEQFADDKNVHILLSSEVGSEGVDLQFSRVLINYDLPWNPMRVEQRIGRIDRLGQTSKSISVLNLMHRATIDEAIYDRLFHRLKICEQALGGFEQVLGDQIDSLPRKFLAGSMTEADITAQLDQTAQAIANRLQEEEQLEQEAAGLIAHADVILQSIHSARDLNRWIRPGDLADYVGESLEQLFPGSRVTQSADENIFEIRLSQDARRSYVEWLENEKIRDGRKVLNGQSTHRCVFGKPAPKKKRRVEEITQTHPLVRFVANQVDQTDGHKLRPAVAAEISRSSLPKEISLRSGQYLTCASLWRFGASTVQELVAYSGYSIDDNRALSANEAEALTVTAAITGIPWHEAKIATDLSKLADRAEGALFDEITDRLEGEELRRRAEIQDRSTIQLRAIDRRLRDGQNSLRATIDKLEQRRRSSNNPTGIEKAIKLNESKLRKLQERLQLRREKIEKNSDVSTEQERLLVNVIRVT